MHVIQVRNVREALAKGVQYLMLEGILEETRAGPALVSPVPVTTVYEKPLERVLFSRIRDANPFFHLVESLWMLAGRNDAALLNNYVRDFGERFAEPGVEPLRVIHGAYGHRWRRAFGFDQLEVAVEKLRQDPASRQVVIQMWDTSPAHWVSTGEDVPAGAAPSGYSLGCEDLGGVWRDRPCNTQVYLRVRPKHLIRGGEPTYDNVLDMTVTCRSNDIVWGAYGANAVHFSVLQEYLAAQVGVEVGRYYQVSNNYHVYTSELDRLYARWGQPERSRLEVPLLDDRGPLLHVPLVDSPKDFDRELEYMFNLFDCLGEGPPDSSAHEAVVRLQNGFFGHVAWPMMMTHRAWKNGSAADAYDWTRLVIDQAWRTAAREWLDRRAK